MSRPWLVTPPVSPSPALAAAVGGHPLVAQLLAQRGIDTPAAALPFLDPAAYTPSPPSALVGLDRAAQILHDAIDAGKRILVWGDFDVDGQTSTSLLVAALRELVGQYPEPVEGPERIDFHVPNRFTESHGIRPAKLTEILSDPIRRPDLILTCDTGISDGPGIGLAKDAGVTVVVTDHHDLTAEFAEYVLGEEPACGFSADAVGRESVCRADALVNPKFLAPNDPLRTLPGVGVAYKLVQRLYELAGRAGEAVQFLDLVALGIVADVAEQVNDARYLLQLGLEQLRRTERIGLKALIHNARLNPETLDAESIGFQLGPRMNALGRLDDATVAVELLTTKDAIRAGQLAGQMERLNNQRRLLTSQISGMAFEILEKQPHLLDFNAIVLAHPNWHAGIVGIVASRIVEEYGKPVVLMLNPPGEVARGSARSTPGVDIGGSIAACAHLLIGHGGHPGAAGLSLEADKIDHFRRELSRQIDSHRIDAGPEGLVIDAELRLVDLSLHLVEQVQRLAPFGNGNPQPVFVTRGLAVAEDRRMGRDGTHRRLVLQDEKENKQPLVWFNGADVQLPEGLLDIAYTFNINEYKGERSLQLMYKDIRAAEADILIAGPKASPARLPIHDLRGQSLELSSLPQPDGAFWLAEGTRLGEVEFHSRLQARRYPKGRPLVVWSAPPSAEVLHWLVETLAPSELWLVGRETGDDSLDGVVKAVAAMGKHALAQDGRLPIDRLAARIGVTEAIVRHALFWLEAKRILWVMEWESGGVARIAPGDGLTAGDAGLQEKQAELSGLLAEMRAWRRYFVWAGLAELGLR
ncbi:MAG: DHHA1 domain-containing protein [Caldilineaceae bacterium]